MARRSRKTPETAFLHKRLEAYAHRLNDNNLKELIKRAKNLYEEQEDRRHRQIVNARARAVDEEDDIE